MFRLLLQPLKQQYSRSCLSHGSKIKLKVGDFFLQKNRLRAMHHWAESIFKVDYLREYESIFETALAHESADPGVLFDEKKLEVENLMLLTL
jgi:hypothetical protein